jgi:hypothetical protein
MIETKCHLISTSVFGYSYLMGLMDQTTGGFIDELFECDPVSRLEYNEVLHRFPSLVYTSLVCNLLFLTKELSIECLDNG